MESHKFMKLEKDMSTAQEKKKGKEEQQQKK